jgi:hypothetical protein
VFAITSGYARNFKTDTKGNNDALTTTLAQDDSLSDIEAYYFHFTRRCETCREVERVSSDALKELYDGKIILESINLDDKSSEELAKNLKIEGQTLLIMKGDKKVELTNDGFMYAMTNPDKLKEKIKVAVESLK